MQCCVVKGRICMSRFMDEGNTSTIFIWWRKYNILMIECARWWKICCRVVAKWVRLLVERVWVGEVGVKYEKYKHSCVRSRKSNANPLIDDIITLRPVWNSFVPFTKLKIIERPKLMTFLHFMKINMRWKSGFVRILIKRIREAELPNCIFGQNEKALYFSVLLLM